MKLTATMKITSEINQHVKDPLKSFKTLQRIIAIVCILIPVLLKLCDRDEFYPNKIKLMSEDEMKELFSTTEMDSITKMQGAWTLGHMKLKHCNSNMEISALNAVCKDGWGFRTSVSDYAYSSNSYLFGMLYCIAAMLYIFNGVVYMNTRNILKVDRKGNWYNVIIGLCLIGVILNPNSSNVLLHSLFSILFFALNLWVMLFFSKPDETTKFKVIRMSMGILVLTAFLLWFWLRQSVNLLWAEWVSLTIISVYLFLVAATVNQKQPQTN